MKILELNLKKNIIIVDVPEGSTNHSIEKFDKYFQIHYSLPKKQDGFTRSGGFSLFYKDFGGRKKYLKDIKLICKGSELTEEIARELMEPYYTDDFALLKNLSQSYKYGKAFYVSSAINALKLEIESKGYYWLVNPISLEREKIYRQIGDDFKANGILKCWQKAELKTFKTH